MLIRRRRVNIIAEQPGQSETMKESLAFWHTDVYGSDHAFEMPVFQVGEAPRNPYPVLAYGPHTASKGVKSAFNYITGFNREGDSATYRIGVIAKGLYDMEIRYRLEGDATMQFCLDFSENSYPVEFLPGNEPVQIKSIPLSPGMTNFTLIRKAVHPEKDLRIYEMVLRITEN